MLACLLARSKIVVAQNTLVKPLVCDGPRPGAARLAAEQALRAGGLLEHAVFLHGLHLVARGVREEVFEVLIFEGESVAGDAL